MNDDVISRQAAIRWVKTECNPYGKPTLDFESGKKVIEHLKQMPSAMGRDLISRQAAIDALGEEPLAWTEGEYELGLQNQWQSDVDALKALPSAQPERMCVNCERKEEGGKQ